MIQKKQLSHKVITIHLIIELILLLLKGRYNISSIFITSENVLESVTLNKTKLKNF